MEKLFAWTDLERSWLPELRHKAALPLGAFPPGKINPRETHHCTATVCLSYCFYPHNPWNRLRAPTAFLGEKHVITRACFRAAPGTAPGCYLMVTGPPGLLLHGLYSLLHHRFPAKKHPQSGRDRASRGSPSSHGKTKGREGCSSAAG